jgi:hypothetical protein
MKERLSIPEKFKVVTLLALGYRREKLDVGSKAFHLFRRRRKLGRIVSLEEIGNFAKLKLASEKNH